MFDFEKFTVYIKSEECYQLLIQEIFPKKMNSSIKDQLQRASTSILLNIAEWSWKYSKADKKNFYIVARWSVFECVAILRILKIEKIISQEIFVKLYNNLEEIGKMLSGLINSFVK